MIVACYGLLRLSEIETLLFEDMTFEAAAVFIKIRRKKQSGVSKKAIFAIDNETCVQILTQYIVLFPEAQRVGRFLRYFQDEKSTNRPVGKNKIAEYPKRVATFLGLSPEGFTGHCWRRTTATILSETDIPLIQFKNAGGWHSDSVCQGYVQESKREKLQISSRISLCEDNPISPQKRSRENEPLPVNAGTTIYVDMSHSSGCTFQYFTPNHLITYQK